jgi:serine/threonine protein kinase
VQVSDEQEKSELINLIKSSFSKGLNFSTSLEFYKLGKPLGKGAFGKVYLGVHKLTGLKVAIKTIEKTFMQDERTRKKVFQEVYIMNKVHDKNVIRLLELFESPKHLMIVLEYAGGGDLLQLLRTRGKLHESEARPIFKQVIDAVQACHREDIIHRDIKLDNILLNEELTLIKLCDFGVSRVAKRGSKLTEQCGTPAYLAPEIIVNEGYEPFFVDVWSMGILLYALMSATVPFKAKTVPELHKIILRGKYEFPEYFSEVSKSFIAEMLNPVPHLRIKLEDLKKHEWFFGESMESSFHSTSDSVNPNKQQVILKDLENFGFPRDFIETSLKNREINHATATYNLLDINMLD